MKIHCPIKIEVRPTSKRALKRLKLRLAKKVQPK